MPCASANLPPLLTLRLPVPVKIITFNANGIRSAAS
jgi:hypothetical protein